jgi:hypothetical protein
MHSSIHFSSCGPLSETILPMYHEPAYQKRWLTKFDIQDQLVTGGRLRCSLGKSGINLLKYKNSLIWSVCHFPWCKYSPNGQFEATNMLSPKVCTVKSHKSQEAAPAYQISTPSQFLCRSHRGPFAPLMRVKAVFITEIIVKGTDSELCEVNIQISALPFPIVFPCPCYLSCSSCLLTFKMEVLIGLASD